MITEDYVSFKIAKLLKENGFNECCRAFRSPSGKLFYSSHDIKNFEDGKTLGGAIAAPTLQMAIKWLREVHNCSIEITSNGYLIDNDATWECDIKFRHRLYFRHIQCQKIYEDCAEAAIKYSLEHLI